MTTYNMNEQKTTVVVRLILEKEKQILFLKKTAQNGGGFSLVGGKVDEGESGNDAIIRESHEEANIKVKSKHLRLVHIYKRESVNELILLFTAKKWSGELASNEPEKFKKVVWIAKDNLPKGISPVTQHLLKEYFSGNFLSESFALNALKKKLN